MKPLTVTYGPSWPGHTALPADGTQVGTVRFRATTRLADGTGATIGEINGRLVVVGGQIVVKGATNALSLKLLGSTRADGSPRAPRYEVRETLTLDGRDIPQTFVIEPYEDAAVADTWDYRSPPVQGLTYVGQLPLSLEQAQQYAQDFQAAANSINDALADAQAAAGYRPAAQQAAGYLNDAQEAAGYLAPLAAAKDQADQDHTRAATDHQQVVDNLNDIAQDRAATIAATAAATAVIDAVRGDALYLRGEVPGGVRLYSLDPDRIRASSVTLRAAGTTITASAVRVRFTQ